MEIKRGIPVAPGVAIAPAVVLDAEEYRIPQRTIVAGEVEHHLALIRRALNASREEITQLRENYVKRLGEQTAAIFDFHERLLSDQKLRRKLLEMVSSSRYSAAYAVSLAMRTWEKNFLNAKDRVFRERVKDIHDIEKRLLRHVLGSGREDVAHLRQQVVIIAHDLTPSQAAGLHDSKVKGFALDAGGRTSHTAIIARSLGLPAVIGLNDVSNAVTGGDTVIIDGHHGMVIVNPDEKTLSDYSVQAERFVRFESELDELVGFPAVTQDGTEIALMGNIEFAGEVTTSISKGAVGIGLYRTEYLYLSTDHEPTEEEHYETYKAAVQAAEGRPIVIRTADLGADKYTQERSLEPERNPFLGCRSIRYCLQNLDMFKTQLRAILRAAVHGHVEIMFPLITGIMEVQQAKTVLADVCEDLEEDGVAYRCPDQVGIMIETPAAAMTARQLAEHVDFFSIGTNDLVQYSLAVDRGNERVAHLFTPSHPAVLAFIRNVVRVAYRKQKGVSLCGEMAGDPMYTLLLLGLGLRSLSMVPGVIPEVKKVVRSITISHAERVARRVMSFASVREVNNYLRDETRKLLPDLY